MRRKPLISVLMTTLNSERFLAEAIESILDQTFKDYEFIIVDGDSSDRTNEIVQQYDDPRINLYIRDGIRRSKQLNYGVRHAQGYFIAIVDSDDIVLPERLKEQVVFLEQNKDVSIVGSWAFVISETGKYLYTLRRPLKHKRIISNILTMNGICFGTSCWRKDIFDKYAQFNEKLPFSEDTEWLQRIAPYTLFANIPKPLMYLRKTEKSRSRSSNHENTVLISSLEDILNSSQRADKIKFLHLGILHYYYGKMSTARKYLIKSFLKWPLKLLTLRYLCPTIFMSSDMMKRTRQNSTLLRISSFYRNLGVWLDLLGTRYFV